MGFSSGVFSLVAGNPVVTNTTISSTWANNTLTDIATGLSSALLKDGTQTVTANIPMATFRFTGVGNPVNLQDLMTVKNYQNNVPILLATVAGTNTITATVSPTPSAYAAGQVFWFVVANTNSGATTINISSLGAIAITKNGTTALTGGELVQNALVAIAHDGTRFQIAGGSGGTALNLISAAGAANSINNGDNAQTWNWALTTASKSAFLFTENTAATNGVGAQYLLDVQTIAASTAEPFRVKARAGVDNILVSRVGAVTITGTTGTIGGGSTGSGITITGGAGATANAGGAVSLTGGAGTTSGTGGNATLQAGDGGATGLGGIVNITGAISGVAQSGNSGGLVLTAGAAGAVASVAGGPILITAGAGSTTVTGGVGGAVTIKSGAGGLALASGALTIESGTGGATGASGNVSLKSGAGGGTSGASGTVTVSSGTTTSGSSGLVTISTASGTGGGGVAGGVTISTGNTLIGLGGAIAITAGNGSTNNVVGGTVTITTGNGNGTQAGGAGGFVTGNGGLTGAGGALSITSGNGGGTSGQAGAIGITVGTATSGNGSNITATAGNGAGGTNGGGNINLIPGTAVSTGTPGEIQVNSVAGTNEVTYTAPLMTTAVPATGTAQPIYIATRAMRLKRAYCSVVTHGTSETISLTKDASAGAPGSGTAMLAAVMTPAANNTPVTQAASATIATATLAAGDRISFLTGGTIGAAAGLTITMLLVPC